VGDCLGFVDVIDCVEHVLDQVDKHLRVNDLNAFKSSILYSDVSSILNQSDRNPFIPILDSAPLTSVIPVLSSGVHRVPIFSAVTKNFTGVLSQSDFIQLLAGIKGDVGQSSLLRKSISELGYPASFITSGSNELVYDLLRIMKTQKVTAIPLVNEKFELEGCFSSSDIKSFPLEDWARLFQDVRSFLTEKHKQSLNPVAVNPNSNFSEVLSKMQEFKVHRVFVIDDERKPVGIISMTDVIKWIEQNISP